MTMRLDFISFLEIFRATRSMVQLREYFIFQRKVVRRPSPSSSCSPSSRRCVCANCTFVVFSLAFGRLCCWWCGGVVFFLWRDARTAHSGVCLKCVFRREAASREKCGVRLLELGGVDVAHHTTHPVASELLHRLALRLEIDGLFLVLELFSRLGALPPASCPLPARLQHRRPRPRRRRKQRLRMPEHPRRSPRHGLCR